MSIEIDWEVTDAPTNDEEHGGPQRPPPGGPPRRLPPEPPQPDSPLPQRRRAWWLAVPIVLGLVGLLGLNYITRLGWQRLSDEVIALVRYEEQLSEQGETLLVLRVQDYTNSQWLEVRSAQVAAKQPAPLPVPVLTPLDASVEIGPLELVATDWVRTEVSRQYETPDGQRVTFTLPQFYRRQGGDENWVRTAAPDSYWGTWHDWQSAHLFVRHSQRDQALVEKVGPQLETLLREACALWGDACVNLPPAKLFFSGYVGSLDYDPLANIRVRVEFGDAASGNALPADYFLSVPSPQMSGVPADAATEQYLTEYLAVRLIASLADQATETQNDADWLTSQAVARLGLGDADPGFADAGDSPPRGEDGIMSQLISPPAEKPRAGNASVRAPGATIVSQLNPAQPLVTYEVRDGDTLLGIAVFHGVSVDALAVLNGIENPDFIQAGTRLLIPPTE